MKLKGLKIFLLVACFGIQCAYYNTFYNAKATFEKAEEERKKKLTTSLSTPQVQYYDKAIKKAFKVLENYPTSKYVDDALMILGQSFFYQNKYLKAKRKFEELLANFPNSDFALEAKLWLGRTLLKLEDFVQAEAMFKELLSAKTNRKIRSQSQFLLGELFFVKQEYSKAIQEYEKSFKEAKDKEIKAKARFQIGRCRRELQDFQRAAGDFLWVKQNSPDKQLKFDAYFNYGLILKASAKYDLAMEVFTKLLQDERNSKKFPKVRLEVAACQRFMALATKETVDNGSVAEAIEQYQSIIVDYPRSEAAAEAYFRLGIIYLQELKDYAKAKDSFDKVKTENPKSEFVTEAGSWSLNIDKFLRLKQSIKTKEELLTELSSKDSSGSVAAENQQQKFFQKSTESDSIITNEKELKNQTESETLLSKENPEEIAEKLARDKFLLAELYLFKFSQIDSVLALYTDILKNHPKTPYAPKALYSSSYIFEEIKQNPTLADSLYRLLIELYPHSLYAEKARIKLNLPVAGGVIDSAKTIFLEAEEEFFEKGNPEKAIKIYSTVVDDYPHSRLAPKALYAIGWIYEHDLNSNSKAIAIYQRLMKDFPQSPYSKTVKKKLALLERKDDVAPKKEESNSQKQADEKGNVPTKTLY